MPSVPPRPSRGIDEARQTSGQPTPIPKPQTPSPKTAGLGVTQTPQPSRSQPVTLQQTQQPAANQNKRRLSALRTFSRDVSTTVQTNQVSMADIALAEQRRRESQPRPKTARRSYMGTLLLIVLLLGVGGAALYVGYQALQPPANLVGPENVRQPLIITETEEEIEITNRSEADIREQLKTRLQQADITIASIREYFFTVQQLVGGVPAKLFVGAPLFLDSLNTGIPPDLLRNLADRFMYGIFSFDGNRGFLMVRPTSLSIAFAGMLEWEDSGLIRDVAPILTPEQLTQDDIFAPFTDAVISNQDVRIARDPQGNEVLMYSLTSQNMLVITSDSETFREVIARLNTPPPVAR